MKKDEEISDSADGDALMERALRITQGFAAWPAAAMRQLLLRSRLGRHERGAHISRENGEPDTFAIVSGHVVMGRTPQGGLRSVVGFLGPGLVIGLSPPPEGEYQVVHDFRAHTQVVAVHMPTQWILELLESDPALWKNMGLMLLRQHRAQLDTMLGQVVGPLPKRLAATIERLTAPHGDALAGSIAPRLRVTQEDLAGILQVTRQTVHKELKSLAASGCIRLSYNAVTVVDLAALRKVSRSA